MSSGDRYRSTGPTFLGWLGFCCCVSPSGGSGGSTEIKPTASFMGFCLLFLHNHLKVMSVFHPCNWHGHVKVMSVLHPFNWHGHVKVMSVLHPFNWHGHVKVMCVLHLFTWHGHVKVMSVLHPFNWHGHVK